MKKLILIGLFVTSFCFVNAQIEQNDSIKSKTEKKEFIDPIYGTPIPNPKKKSSIFFPIPDKTSTTKQKKPLTTPGDYIKRSGTLKLTSIGLSIASGMMYLHTDNDVFIVTGLISFGLYIGGEICLIKAGKLMNEERVTLSPASEGIGLAINF